MESKRDVRMIGGGEEEKGGGVEVDEGGGECSGEEDEVMYLVSCQVSLRRNVTCGGLYPG